MLLITENLFGIFACNGILFNHESPRRGETFVTRKITRGLSRIDVGLDDCLHLGNLDAKRDWGHAKDFVKMQWMMLQIDQPEDFVIATGREETVRRFIELSAKALGWGNESEPIIWEGRGLNEIGIRPDNGKTVIKVDKRYFRPAEVEILLGDATKAKTKLGWEPTISLEELVEEMIKSDKLNAQRELMIKNK